jgi:hypothetical protein
MWESPVLSQNHSSPVITNNLLIHVYFMTNYVSFKTYDTNSVHPSEYVGTQYGEKQGRVVNKHESEGEILSDD